jgi:hypothetical protein
MAATSGRCVIKDFRWGTGLSRKGLIHDRDTLDLIRIQSSCAFLAEPEEGRRDPVRHGDCIGLDDLDQVFLRSLLNETG